jgi:hypothetical protein
VDGAGCRRRAREREKGTSHCGLIPFEREGER